MSQSGKRGKLAANVDPLQTPDEILKDEIRAEETEAVPRSSDRRGEAGELLPGKRYRYVIVDTAKPTAELLGWAQLREDRLNES